MPVALDRSTIELMKNLLKLRRIENRIAISPDGNRSTRSENAFRFAKKRIGIEPMKRLRYGDQID